MGETFLSSAIDGICRRAISRPRMKKLTIFGSGQRPHSQHSSIQWQWFVWLTKLRKQAVQL